MNNVVIITHDTDVHIKLGPPGIQAEIIVLTY